MTNSYYTENVLPQHIHYIHEQRKQGWPAVLMEDGDPSHGHRTVNNHAHQARVKSFITLHDHPPQSPDLNPIEGVWLLLNERLKQLHGDRIATMGYWQLKDAVSQAWKAVTLPEIQARIADMPWRCKQLVKTGGKRIKGAKW
jgi:hypothetical protein